MKIWIERIAIVSTGLCALLLVALARVHAPRGPCVDEIIKGVEARCRFPEQRISQEPNGAAVMLWRCSCPRPEEKPVPCLKEDPPMYQRQKEEP